MLFAILSLAISLSMILECTIHSKAEELEQQVLNRNKILIGSTIYYDDTGIIDDKHIKEVNDAGIDFIITETKKDQDSLLNLAEKYNIGVIGGFKNFGFWAGSSNGELQKFAKELKENPTILNTYQNHVSRVGDTIFDEPQSSEFKALGDVYDIYKNKFPDKFLFVNLFPTIATPEMLQTKDYQEYINKFIELVKTDYICFDIYPFYNNSIIEPTYINNLNIVGKACRDNNRDMWGLYSNPRKLAELYFTNRKTNKVAGLLLLILWCKSNTARFLYSCLELEWRGNYRYAR